MNRRTLGFPLVAAAALAGCGSLGSPGSLSKGAFAYVCTSNSGTTDVGCSSSLLSSRDVPASIAVGTHFDLQYGAVFGSDAPIVTTLAPVSPSLLATETALDAGATGFRFTGPGTVAILAHAADGSVVDFLHVTGVVIDHVSLQDPLGLSVMPFQVPAGGAMLRAVPQGNTGEQLAGEMAYTWSSSDPTVATVQGGGNGVTILPAGPGKATISVQVLGKQASVDVTVVGGV
jgi:hypothetical protein